MKFSGRLLGKKKTEPLSFKLKIDKLLGLISMGSEKGLSAIKLFIHRKYERIDQYDSLFCWCC